MTWALRLVTGPAAEPLSAAEARTHLRYPSTDLDAYIGELVKAARVEAEEATCRALVAQTWELQLDGFPGGRQIRLPRPPLRSVTSVKYSPAGATELAMSTSDYAVDTCSEPGRVVLRDGASWPGVALEPAGAVKVRFVAGYSTSAAGVPADLKHALRLAVGRWFAHAEDVVVGQVARKLPIAADAAFKARKFVYPGPAS